MNKIHPKAEANAISFRKSNAWNKWQVQKCKSLYANRGLFNNSIKKKYITVQFRISTIVITSTISTLVITKYSNNNNNIMKYYNLKITAWLDFKMSFIPVMQSWQSHCHVTLQKSF